MSTAQKIGFLLIIGGVLAALGFFLRWFFTEPEVPLVAKVITAVILTGLVTLFFVAGWQRYGIVKAKDPFKEVKY